MPTYDISRKLRAGIATWPGDTPYQLERLLSISEGATVNLSSLHLSVHTGTHVDAPFHFLEAGAGAESLDLSVFWGKAQVVSVNKEHGPLIPEDFSHIYPLSAPRLLVHSAASHKESTVFDTEIVYPSPELAAWLGEQGTLLYGTDAPSMDQVDSKELPGHHALFQHGISILEGLDLSKVPDGVYELVALPLSLEGADGSPVRAALRSW